MRKALDERRKTLAGRRHATSVAQSLSHLGEALALHADYPEDGGPDARGASRSSGGLLGTLASRTSPPPYPRWQTS